MRWRDRLVAMVVVAAVGCGVAAGTHLLVRSRGDEGRDADRRSLSEGPGLAASPLTDLGTAAPIDVTGRGLPAELELQVHQCAGEGLDRGAYDACDRFDGTTLMTEADGSLDASVVVRRHITASGSAVDCADVRCVMSIFRVDGSAEIARFALGFRPDDSGPTVRLVGDGTLDHLDRVAVAVDGDDGERLSLAQCTHDGCDEFSRAVVALDANGHAEVGLVAARVIVVDDEPIDCAPPGSCVVRVERDAGGHTDTTLAFGPGPTPPTTSFTLTRTPDGVEIVILDTLRTWHRVEVCPGTDAAACTDLLGHRIVGPAPSTTTTVSRARLSDACAGSPECRVRLVSGGGLLLEQPAAL